MRKGTAARLIGLLVAGAVLAACGSGTVRVSPADGAPDGAAGLARTVQPTPTSTTVAQAEDERTIGIYASALRQAFTHDHTFGRGKPPFRRIYVVEARLEGSRFPRSASSEERLTPPMKSGIARALADLPPVEFVATGDDARTGRTIAERRVKNRGAIYSLGPIVGFGDRVEVESHMWCGVLCALSLVYIVERTGDEWRVTGDTGTRVIS